MDFLVNNIALLRKFIARPGYQWLQKNLDRIYILKTNRLYGFSHVQLM